MKINQLLTPYNHNKGTVDRIQYLVIHYVGATGGAKANCEYYAGGDRGASAHYYVDFDGSIWQSVEDKDIAWHCGGKKYPETKGGTYHGICTNANSIGIELCVRNRGSKADTSRDWYFEDATVESAIEWTRELMAKYHIPADHVIRHYDVVGKICPNPYVYNDGKHTWQAFQAAIRQSKEQKLGWQRDDNGWWYAQAQGEFYQSCWQVINGHKYYFNSDGYSVTDWQRIDDKWYYFEPRAGHPFECALYVSDADGAQEIGSFAG